jgi:Concanavalin A-like lectin/glucanases superfamily/FecR protein
MNSHVDTDRIHLLTSRLCDGDVTAQELGELAVLMEGNEAAAREYLEITSLHLQLEHRLRAVHPDPETAIGRKQSTSDVDARGRVAAPGGRERDSATRWLALLAVAASLLMIASVWFHYAGSNRSFAARIDKMVDCDWDEVRWKPVQIATLDGGREIRFEHGLMMLEFGDGAKVAMEGPVRFTVVASDRVLLSLGKLTATVPKRGHGFAVQMPAAEVIDLGTKFGALVTADGSCEAHVFEGKVLVRSGSGKQPKEELELVAGSALRIAAGLGKSERIAAKPESFVHAARFVDPVVAGNDIPLNIPPGSHPVLWLDAAKRLQLDAAGKVISWGNLCSNEEGNAWQVDAKQRPAWISRAFDNRPVVGFDGSKYLVTTPFPSANDVTIFCVLQTQQENSGVPVGEVLDLNGPSNLVVGLTRGNHLIGKVSTTLGNADSANAGLLEAPLPEGEMPILAVYVYGHSSNRSSLYVNGRLVGEAPAPAIIASRSPKFIGKSSSVGDHFVGNLSEMLVFNSTLSDEQCMRVSEELMSKYGIEKMESEPRVLYRPHSEGEQ